jgi:putative methionine-R-sulfoxide reductase with GAF domain
MDPRSILDKANGEASAPSPALARHEAAESTVPDDVRFPGEDGGKSLAEMAQRDLSATLQLLAERAQYITGASGTAIALRDHEEMVCRASAGPSAPEVGAQLQVNSGLSGESVRTQQTLRCDDAFTDERVNRESCEALGIRSVVVMPLIRGGEVIGVFELFSDKAHVFESRDITALERVGAMVHTALDQSAEALGIAPIAGEAGRPARAFDHPNDTEEAGEFAAQSHIGDGTRIHEQLENDAIAIFREDEPTQVEPALSSEGEVAPAGRPRQGIAFHRKMPTATAPAHAAPAVIPFDSVPHGVQPAIHQPENPPETAPNADDGDILEIAADPPKPAVASPKFSANEEILPETSEPTLRGFQPARYPWTANKPAPGDPADVIEAKNALEISPETPVVASRGEVASLRKCETCGFPVSEGRRLCLDCEKKAKGQEASASKSVVADESAGEPPAPAELLLTPTSTTDAPLFMSSNQDESSWLADHKFMVIAIVLAAVGITAVLLLR